MMRAERRKWSIALTGSLLVCVGCARAPDAVSAQQEEPRGDVDHDDIALAVDMCPCHGEDMDGFEDADGCPERDNDQDHRVDACDACPNEYEVYNGEDDFDGCPDVGEIRVIGSRDLILESVYFSHGSAQLTAREQPIIDAMVSAIVDMNITLVEIQGRAAADEPNPRRLATLRAEAVRDRMIAGGVDPERLVARGYGADDPRAPPGHPDASAGNRRAEFRLLDFSPPPRPPPQPPDPCDPPPPAPSACATE